MARVNVPLHSPFTTHRSPLFFIHHSPFSLPDRAHAGVVFDVRMLGVYAYAGGEMVWFDLGERRDDLLTIFDRERTPSVKVTTRWGIDRRWNVTFKDYAFACRFDLGIGHGHGRDESDRIGHQRLCIDLFTVGQFDDLPEIHHGDTIRQMPNC